MQPERRRAHPSNDNGNYVNEDSINSMGDFVDAAVEPQSTEGTKRQKTRYVIISPVRDEGEYIEETILSVMRQTVQPAHWVIVDDGSSDDTAGIAGAYAERCGWISCVRRSNRGHRAPGAGVIEAFEEGYAALSRSDWEFVVKLDGDLTLPPDYFEKCFEQFEGDPSLGIGGGTLYHLENGEVRYEANPRFHVRGATKMYRRACWEALGGLLRSPGWDSVDEVKANYLGWRTRSFPDVKALHKRPTGRAMGAWSDAVKNGLADYVAGYHPLFLLAKCVRRCAQRPYLVCSLGMLFGAAKGYIRRVPRVPEPKLVKYLRRQQLRRLAGLETIWR